MKQDGRTTPRVPYAEEYRNRKGLSETIQDHSTRIKNVELRANQTPLPGESIVEVRVDGVLIGSESILDFIAGANVTLTGNDDGTAILITIEATGGGGASPLTTKGDIWGFDAADNRIPVGADGEVLTADSGAALGVSWQPGTVVTGGGLLGWDYVVFEGYAGSDGDVLTDVMGATALAFTTLQAMVDEWAANATGPMAAFVIGNSDNSQLAGALIGEPASGSTSLLMQGIPGNDTTISFFWRTVLGNLDVQTSALIELRDIEVFGSWPGVDITQNTALDFLGMIARRCKFNGVLCQPASGNVALLQFEDCEFRPETRFAHRHESKGIVVESSEGFGVTKVIVRNGSFADNARIYLDSRRGGDPVILRVADSEFIGDHYDAYVETIDAHDEVIAIISDLFMDRTSVTPQLSDDIKGLWADGSYFGPCSPPDYTVEDYSP